MAMLRGAVMSVLGPGDVQVLMRGSPDKVSYLVLDEFSGSVACRERVRCMVAGVLYGFSLVICSCCRPIGFTKSAGCAVGFWAL